MASDFMQTSYKAGASQNVAFTGGGSAEAAAALSGNISVVRLLADADCRVSFNGDATATSMRLAAGVPEYFSCDDADIISVYPGADDGSLNITEMDQ